MKQTALFRPPLLESKQSPLNVAVGFASGGCLCAVDLNPLPPPLSTAHFHAGVVPQEGAVLYPENTL